MEWSRGGKEHGSENNIKYKTHSINSDQHVNPMFALKLRESLG